MSYYEMCERCKVLISKCMHLSLGIVVLNDNYHYSGSARLCMKCMQELIGNIGHSLTLTRVEDSLYERQRE